MQKKKRNGGFTLVELLVVIAVLAVLATVSIVGYTSFVEKIPLYKNESAFMLQANQSLSFEVKLEGTFDVTIEGFNIKVVATEEITPDEDGVISGITKNTDEIITVVSTNENDKEDISISCYEVEIPDSES